ncbi:hypothetical protein L208DRAFT_1380044 [Tricholoma matsutake]|nr:hypothetical protein L208DRAFT_1380044 [Tricholoma matsutake 945]
MSESDRRKAAMMLGVAADRFRDELGSAKVDKLVLITGFLQFTCHLREDPAFDKAWIYRVGRGWTDTRMNAKGKMMLLKRESERTFVCLELERVTIPESKTMIDSLGFEPVPVSIRIKLPPSSNHLILSYEFTVLAGQNAKNLMMVSLSFCFVKFPALVHCLLLPSTLLS